MQPDNNMFQPSQPQGPPPQPQGPLPQPVMPQGNQQPPITASEIKEKPPIVFIVIVVVLSLLLIGSSVFGFMMMSSRNDFRDNVQSKIDVAVAEAEKAQQEKLEAEFVEREKEPYRTYSGPSEFGSLRVEYPKTWAAYVVETGKGKKLVDGYLHPNFVPDVNSGISFALHFEILQQPYEKELNSYSSDVRKGIVTVKPITLDKVPSVSGSRIDGEVEKDKQGSVVLLPIRDKTIKVSVLSDQYIKDFDEIILKQMSFTP